MCGRYCRHDRTNSAVAAECFKVATVTVFYPQQRFSLRSHSLSSIPRHVLEWARETPSAVAVISGDSSLTYAELAGRLAQVLQGIEALGVAPGRVVGLACADRLRRLLLMLACELAGAFHMALDPLELASDGETSRRCDLFLSDLPVRAPKGACGVRLVDQDFFARAHANTAGPDDLLRLDHMPAGGLGGRIARTSGTTGEPKYMLKTAEIGDAILRGYDETLGVLDRGVTFICAYSPAIGGVYTDVLRVLRCGGQVRFVSSFQDIVDAAGGGPGYAFLLPREAERIAAECRSRGLSLNLLYVDVTGAAISPNLREALERTLSPRIANIYSSNEASIIAAQDPDGLFTICPGVEIRILDEQGRPRAPGEVGHISVRSPLLVHGYLWNEALTAKHFSDGWLLTSDLGRIPEPGRLQVLGRDDDMLNIGGEKIAPYPIEQALRATQGVEEAILLRIEGATGVGRMCAVLEPAPGADRDRMVETARRILAGHGRDFIIRLDTRLPRSDTGKVRRELVQRRVQAELAGEVAAAPSPAITLA